MRKTHCFQLGWFTIMVRNHGHMATLKSMTTSVYVYWGHAQHVAVKQLRHHWMIKPRGVVWITPASISGPLTIRKGFYIRGGGIKVSRYGPKGMRGWRWTKPSWIFSSQYADSVQPQQEQQ